MKNNSQTYYFEFLIDKRSKYSLYLFANIDAEFFVKHKINPKSLKTAENYRDLCTKKYLGKYLHNITGPAYGALYRDNKTGELFSRKGWAKIPHKEFWKHGKRLWSKDNKKEKKLILAIK